MCCAAVADTRRVKRTAAAAALSVALLTSACGAAADGSGSTASPTSAPSGSTASGATVVTGERTYAGLARDHVGTPVRYPQSPPVGGAHSRVWMACDGRIYDSAIPLEKAVHSLEHGAVWVTWQPSLAPTDVEMLHALIEGVSYRLGSPYPGLTAVVTVTAWGHQMDADSVSDPRIATFLDAYTNGPQTPEPGATCGDPTGASPDVHSG